MSDQRRNARLKTCEACEHNVRGRCRKAGRHVQVLVRAEEPACPQAKWPEQRPAERGERVEGQRGRGKEGQDGRRFERPSAADPDRAGAQPVDSRRRVQQQATAIVTAFRRPRCLERLLQSLRAYYPELPVVVADSGDRPAEVDDPLVNYLRLPFDCGLPRARNRAVEQVQTPYTLLLDDDYEFYDRTRIEWLWEILQADDRLGVAAGIWRWKDGDWTVAADTRRRLRKIEFVPPRSAWQWTDHCAYRDVDVAENFFLARTDVLLDYPWDDRLKILAEHWDFFFALKAASVGVAYTPEVAIRHRPERTDDYATHRHGRNRDQAYRRHFCRKWDLAEFPRHRHLCEEGAPPRREPPIPRTLHFIWIGDDPLPEQHARYMDKWRKLHPDWTVRIWHETAIRNLLPGELRRCYDRAASASQASEIARYEIVRRHGGVYADTDYEPLRPLDELLAGCRAFVCKANDPQCPDRTGTGLFGAAPGHPFLAHLVRDVPRVHDPAVPDCLSPPFFDPRVRRHADVRILEAHAFFPVHWRDYRAGRWDRAQTEGAYAIHHFAGSWVTDDAVQTDKPRPSDAPPVVILTPSHTGSSVLAAMLARLGWSLPADADEYAESPVFRELNRAALRGRWDRDRWRKFLAGQPSNVALKDPRLLDSVDGGLLLDWWRPLLADRAPVLVYSGRDRQAVLDSCGRRGEDPRFAKSRLANVEAALRGWPWAVHRVDFDALAGAVGLFDPARIGAGRLGFRG